MKKNKLILTFLTIAICGCSSNSTHTTKKTIRENELKIIAGDLFSGVSKLEIKRKSEKLIYKIRTSI